MEKYFDIKKPENKKQKGKVSQKIANQENIEKEKEIEFESTPKLQEEVEVQQENLSEEEIKIGRASCRERV